MDFIILFILGMAVLFVIFFIVYAIQAGAIVGVAALGFKAFGRLTADKIKPPFGRVDPLSSHSTLDELERLAALKQNGLLSDDEFDTLKKRLLP